MRLWPMKSTSRQISLSLSQAVLLGISLLFAPGSSHAHGQLPALQEVLDSKLDLWGEAALRQTNGPSYEFFAPLLPPPRYVNADFREYPIVLSAPRNVIKARLVSNGSAINARAGARSWNEPGIPVTFRVGADELRFGEYPERLSEPRYLKGHLPIVQIRYAHGENVYEEESFASVDPAMSPLGIVFVRFSLLQGTNGEVAAHPEPRSDFTPSKGSLVEESGKAVIWYDNNWKWLRQRLAANLSSNSPVVLAIATRPMDRRNAVLGFGEYEEQRRKCIATWESFLQNGMQVEVAEPLVTNAWRATLIGNMSMVQSNRMNYSAGNQYEKLYEAEGSDATEAMLLWGHTALGRELIPPLLNFTRKGLEFHQAGHKLQLLARYFWLTRDTDFLKATGPQWSNELHLILRSRTNAEGLFPREQYCGDIATPVFSLNSNAKCWRALRDFVPVLNAFGQAGQGQICLSNASVFRKNIIAAVASSESKEVEPPFIPIALFGEESAYEAITGSRIGSYWNLMANYVLGARVFGLRSERENALIEYVERHGGLCCGLIRSRPAATFWTGPNSINPLYGQRRVAALLERDEPDKALVAFYGMLAQGMTRETFIAGEGCSLTPLDSRGRLFYCPPNSAANGFVLTTLRQLLVQDLDLDDDGEPETLRLLFGASRRWLDNEKTIRVDRAPTAFGPVSLVVKAQLERGQLTAIVEMPPRLPQRTLLRLRLPEGWRPVSAQVGERPLRIDQQGTVELAGLLGKVEIQFTAERVQQPP